MAVTFVTWTPQWRADRMATGFGAAPLLPAPAALGWPWPLRYLVQSVATAVALARSRPAVVIFTNPPVVTGLVLVLLKPLLGFAVWADCHSGPWTDPRWTRFGRLNAWVLARCDGGLFHNGDLLAEHGHEVTDAVLSRTPPLMDLADRDGSRRDDGRYVVAVLSYSADEPVDVLLEAARQSPAVRFRFTGSAPERVVSQAPSNVAFTGFVPTREYEALLRGAAAVICLTTMPATMQQGIADAIEAGVLGITSDTATMRDWVDGTATCVLVDWRDPAAVASAARAATERGSEYDEGGRSRLLRRSRAEFEGFAVRIGERASQR